MLRRWSRRRLCKVWLWQSWTLAAAVGELEEEAAGEEIAMSAGKEMEVVAVAAGEEMVMSAGKEKEVVVEAVGSVGTASEGVTSSGLLGEVVKEAIKQKRTIEVDWASLEEADRCLSWGEAADAVFPSKKVKTVEPLWDSEVEMSEGSKEGPKRDSSSPLLEVGYENVGPFSGIRQNEVAYLSEEEMVLGFGESGD